MNSFLCGDFEIRIALLRRTKAAVAYNKEEIVVEELGLAHAKRRIDVAVISSDIHGFEIKSDRDTLVRLPSQLEIYSKTPRILTIVCSKRYIERVLSLIPD